MSTHLLLKIVFFCIRLICKCLCVVSKMATRKVSACRDGHILPVWNPCLSTQSSHGDFAGEGGEKQKGETEKKRKRQF